MKEEFLISNWNEGHLLELTGKQNNLKFRIKNEIQNKSVLLEYCFVYYFFSVFVFVIVFCLTVVDYWKTPVTVTSSSNNT